MKGDGKKGKAGETLTLEKLECGVKACAREARKYLAQLQRAAELLVDAVEEGDFNLSEGLIGYYRISEEYKGVDDVRKEIWKRLERLDKGTLPDAFESEGVDKVRVPQIERSFYVLPKMSASMVDKEEAMAWLRERGADALITETVNASTLSSYVKDLLENEGIDPPECIKVSSYRKTGASKYKPKK